MTTDKTANTLSTVRAYHRGWTTKRFDESITRLAPDLQVEVPVNEYPTRESFARALAGFGAAVQHVALLAEFAQGNAAMRLYDMEVDGTITRIRRIHDTAAVRAAGFAQGA